MSNRGPRHGWRIVRARNMNAKLPKVAIKRVLGRLLKLADVPGGVFTLVVATITTTPEKQASLQLARHYSERTWLNLNLYLSDKDSETVIGHIIIPGKCMSEETITGLMQAAKSVFLPREKPQQRPEQAAGSTTGKGTDLRLKYAPNLTSLETQVSSDPILIELQSEKPSLHSVSLQRAIGHTWCASSPENNASGRGTTLSHPHASSPLGLLFDTDKIKIFITTKNSQWLFFVVSSVSLLVGGKRSVCREHNIAIDIHRLKNIVVPCLSCQIL